MIEVEDVWTEKYRPLKLDEVVGQDEITKRLKENVKSRNLQHMLFTGRPGVGKTASAIALSMELFGDKWAGNFMELNASDERGIDVIRGKVKDYVETQSLGGFEFRILLLDEADSMTNDAQHALRRIMERYSKVCKFILSCNYSSKIIEAIQSRCSIYRFKGISKDAMIERLLYICEKENLKITEDALDAIMYIAEGDMRKAINSLQTASLLGKEINIEMVYKAYGLVRSEDITNLIKYALSGEFAKVLDLLDYLVIEEGFSGLDICKQMVKEVMNMNIDDKRKIIIIDRVGECDFRINDGANEIIQMKALLANICLIGK